MREYRECAYYDSAFIMEQRAEAREQAERERQELLCKKVKSHWKLPRTWFLITRRYHSYADEPEEKRFWLMWRVEWHHQGWYGLDLDSYVSEDDIVAHL